MAQLSQSVFIILPYGAFVKQGVFLAFFIKTGLPEGKPAAVEIDNTYCILCVFEKL